MAGRLESKKKLVHLQQRLLSLRNVKDAEGCQTAALRQLRLENHSRLQEIFQPINALAGTEAALHFFYHELYPPLTPSWRDEQCLRVLPRMVTVMPERATDVLLAAIELDWQTELLDRDLLALRMADQSLDVAEHAARRRLQLQLLGQVGLGLVQVVRLPLMGSLLKCARYPAKAKGLSEMHGFFTRGFEAFRAIRQPDAFMERLICLAEAGLDARPERVAN